MGVKKAKTDGLWGLWEQLKPQVAQAQNMSIDEHRHCCVTFKIYGFVWKKEPTVSVTYENEKNSIKNSLPYLKCVLRLSCVVHEPNYGRFMGFYANGFFSIKTHKTAIIRPVDHTGET